MWCASLDLASGTAGHWDELSSMSWVKALFCRLCKLKTSCGVPPGWRCSCFLPTWDSMSGSWGHTASLVWPMPNQLEGLSSSYSFFVSLCFDNKMDQPCIASCQMLPSIGWPLIWACLSRMESTPFQRKTNQETWISNWKRAAISCSICVAGGQWMCTIWQALLDCGSRRRGRSHRRGLLADEPPTAANEW